MRPGLVDVLCRIILWHRDIEAIEADEKLVCAPYLCKSIDDAWLLSDLPSVFLMAAPVTIVEATAVRER